MHCQQKEEVKRMSEKLYGVDQFYPGVFAPILTGVYTILDHRDLLSKGFPVPYYRSEII